MRFSPWGKGGWHAAVAVAVGVVVGVVLAMGAGVAGARGGHAPIVIASDSDWDGTYNFSPPN